ncbi:hypothetical protein KKH30_05135, partial [Candidatus Micrarchaeota archaeon]|nr:hypothetical protein [Candidatus Micrarchaeota archaeon]MBU1940120.1 hypothetical protein [Candidatus Micrarchaeota archaeon]
MNGMDGIAQAQQLGPLLYRIAILAVLVVALLGVIMWIFGCSIIPVPGACDVWWGVMGEPKVLIVHGDDGLGNPQLLQSAMESKEHLGLRVRVAHLDTITLGNLKDYDLIIVEQARTMSTKKMKMLVDYALGGGRLVWTGDAGAEGAEGDMFLKAHEYAGLAICDDIDTQKMWEERGLRISDVNCTWRSEISDIGPWARRYEDGDRNFAIKLDEMLNIKYIGNYCQFKDCKNDLPDIGKLDAGDEREHPLVLGIRPGLRMNGDFAIVEEGSGLSTRVLGVDYGGSLITKDKVNLGNN